MTGDIDTCHGKGAAGAYLQQLLPWRALCWLPLLPAPTWSYFGEYMHSTTWGNGSG